MKKFINKKGFTLLECIIAIAIFAIMALMVTTIYGATIQQHRANVKNDRELTEQVSDVAANYTGVRTGTSENGNGTLDFNFRDNVTGIVVPTSISYKLHTLGTSPNDYDYNLTLMKGAVNNAINVNNPTPTPTPVGNQGHGGVNARLYGSMGLLSITVQNFEFTGTRDGHNVYKLTILPNDDDTFVADQFSYRQIKLRLKQELLVSCSLLSSSSNVKVEKLSSDTIRFSIDKYQINKYLGTIGITAEIVTDEDILATSTYGTDGLKGFAEYLGLTKDGSGGVTDISMQSNGSNEYVFYELDAVPGVYAYNP